MSLESATRARVAAPLTGIRTLAVGRHVRAFVGQFRLRLLDRRFWGTQILVITISAGHMLLEATHSLGVLPDVALLPVSTYFIPVVYAALNFGVEGAVPTAIWCSLLTVPNLILWHTGAQRPGVLLQLALLVAIAFVIARRVDFETAAKERAEAANARLERLNRTAAASAQSLDLESVLSQTVQAMLDARKIQTSWIMLAANDLEDEVIRVASSAGARAEIGTRELAVTRFVIARPLLGRDGGTGDGAVREDQMAIVPLRVAGRIAGAGGGLPAEESRRDADGGNRQRAPFQPRPAAVAARRSRLGARDRLAGRRPRSANGDQCAVAYERRATPAQPERRARAVQDPAGGSPQRGAPLGREERQGSHQLRPGRARDRVRRRERLRHVGDNRSSPVVHEARVARDAGTGQARGGSVVDHEPAFMRHSSHRDARVNGLGWTSPMPLQAKSRRRVGSPAIGSFPHARCAPSGCLEHLAPLMLHQHESKGKGDVGPRLSRASPRLRRRLAHRRRADLARSARARRRPTPPARDWCAGKAPDPVRRALVRRDRARGRRPDQRREGTRPRAALLRAGVDRRLGRCGPAGRADRSPRSPARRARGARARRGCPTDPTRYGRPGSPAHRRGPAVRRRGLGARATSCLCQRARGALLLRRRERGGGGRRARPESRRAEGGGAVAPRPRRPAAARRGTIQLDAARLRV